MQAQTPKQEVQTILQDMPDDCSVEDIQYHLYVINKVRRSKERLDIEGGVSQEEAEKRLSKWIIK
tara:strand:+ start:150 stop:344 length:195 start_codon:yes stop_codon:yes gene_type:complete